MLVNGAPVWIVEIGDYVAGAADSWENAAKAIGRAGFDLDYTTSYIEETMGLGVIDYGVDERALIGFQEEPGEVCIVYADIDVPEGYNPPDGPHKVVVCGGYGSAIAHVRDAFGLATDMEAQELVDAGDVAQIATVALNEASDEATSIERGECY